MIVNHHFWGSLKVELPNNLSKTYKIGKFINDGTSASVYLLESIKNEDKESLVLKIQQVETKEIFNNEINITKLFNKHGIGPKLYHDWIIIHEYYVYGFMVLEYLKIGEIPILYSNIKKGLTDHYNILNKNILLRDQLIKQIRIIHSLGYIHLDIFESNILYRHLNEITLCDFGLSCKIDLVTIKNIKNIYKEYQKNPIIYDYIKYKKIKIQDLINNPKLIDYIFVWFVWKIDLDMFE